MKMWTKVDRDGPDGIVAAIEELRDAGVPVPSVLAIADLRGLVWRGEDISRRRLADRWGWGDKRVRLLLSDEARWTDPSGGIEGQGPNRGPTRAQQGPNKGPADEGSSETIDSEGPNEGPEGAQQGPKEGHTRVLPTHHTPPAPPPNEDDGPAPPALALAVEVPEEPDAPPKPDPALEHWHAATALWGTTVLPACGRKPSAGPPSHRQGVGAKLLVAVRRDHSAVLDALRFVAESSHDRAAFFRSSGFDLVTVLRHVDEYAGLWRDFGTGPGPQQQRKPKDGGFTFPRGTFETPAATAPPSEPREGDPPDLVELIRSGSVHTDDDLAWMLRRQPRDAEADALPTTH